MNPLYIYERCNKHWVNPCNLTDEDTANILTLCFATGGNTVKYKNKIYGVFDHPLMNEQ